VIEKLKYKRLDPPVQGGLTFLEQLHAPLGQLCPSSRVPFITALSEERKKGLLYRTACKQWNCPVCGPKNALKWIGRILEHLNLPASKKLNWYFLTITAHQSMRGAQASRKNLVAGWKKLYNRMRRKYGISEYVKVWEFHRDGSFHLHILIARKIGKRWLKNNSAECGMGYICDSSRAKNPGQVAGYCAKYMLKSFEYADKYIGGMRRIECSRNWTAWREKDTLNDMEFIIWFSREAQSVQARRLKKDGWNIADKRRAAKTDGSPFI
jgi:hypothetical protein